MARANPGMVFTDEEPLGPASISASIEPEVLRLIYDEESEPHKATSGRPPTFIIGRRGSGKTSLLLSAKLSSRNTVVHLRSDGVYSRVCSMVKRLENQIDLTEEGVADLWETLLWGPVAIAIMERETEKDPRGELTVLHEELEPTRRFVDEHSETEANQDDLVLDYVTQRFSSFLDTNPSIFAADTLANKFQLYSRPWVDCIDAAKQLIGSRRVRVYVLIDSIENIGPSLPQLQLTLRGLFHLVGRIALDARAGPFQIQCCFPSELLPDLHRISANPLKDFAYSTSLQWTARDLCHLINVRLREFLDYQYPGLQAARRL